MRKILLGIFAALILVAAPARAQYTSVQGYVEKGGQSVVVGGQPPTRTKWMESYPGATISVCLTGTSCASLATIYTSATGGAKSNPFVSDTGTGFYQFFVGSGQYDLRFSGTGISTPFTISGITVGTGSPGFQNPMTTEGDMIYQASGNPARLGVGTNGQCLISTGTDPNWTTCPGASSPNPSTPICYASYYGADTNDGLTLATPKADIMACYDALPSSGGTILAYGGSSGINACKATDPAGCGIWIMASGDPNFSSPPAGWRTAKGAVSIIGVTGTSSFFGQGPRLIVLAGNSSNPPIWLSNVVGGFTLQNLSFSSCLPSRFGIDSTGNRSNSNTPYWNGHNNNDNFLASNTVGCGPAVDIGSTSSEDLFENSTFNSTRIIVCFSI